MKSKVLGNVGDLFNELYYIYKDKYNEEKDGLNTKSKKKKKKYYKKLRIVDDYQYDSEEGEKEEEEQQQTSKKPDKTNHLKSQQKKI